tara:strand:+ start:80081 stop:80482 length:402 start_codon:yes stop_codon:yes gene_type:complete
MPSNRLVNSSRRQGRSALSLTVAAVFGLLSAMPAAHAENIDLLMSGLFKQGPTYIGMTSVDRDDIPESANYERKYLIVDFRYQEMPDDGRLQASINTICMAMIRDRELMQRLSNQGYDMVSVAFDRQSQYDCL